MMQIQIHKYPSSFRVFWFLKKKVLSTHDKTKYLNTFVWIHVCEWMCLCMWVSLLEVRGWQTAFSMTFNLIYDIGFLIELEDPLFSWSDWPAVAITLSVSLASLKCWGYRHTQSCPAFYVGAWDPNSEPHVFRTSILPTELYPPYNWLILKDHYRIFRGKGK